MSSGGGYSGGMGGYGGGFGQPPMFGGGFGGGFGQPPQFGGGFGGGFGQPPQYGGGFGSPYGGFGGGFGQPQQFGGGFGLNQMLPGPPGGSNPEFRNTYGVGQPPQYGAGMHRGQTGPGNAYAQRFQNPSVGMFPPTSPDPNQPPPGMELNPDYIDRFAGGMAGTLEVRPTDNKFRPIQQPQPQTGGDLQYRDAQFRPGGGDIQYAGGSPGFYEAQLQAQERQGGQGYGSYDPAGGYLGGFGGGYSSPYMSSAIMSGLGSLFGGMQGGGFQGMFNPQSQAQAQMRAYQQNQQRDPNQPPPGMKLNPTYDAGYAMADDMPLPGSPQALRKQQFIPI